MNHGLRVKGKSRGIFCRIRLSRSKESSSSIRGSNGGIYTDMSHSMSHFYFIPAIADDALKVKSCGSKEKAGEYSVE